ncbi:MAG TPA: dUTP diphosphatase [Phycisphaerae bacterium]|nr:dUTP diphosphatase [Phycisphaerae bacterium]
MGGIDLSLKESVNVQLTWLPHGKGLGPPAYQTAQAAGMDVQAAVTEPVVIEPMQRMAVPCGFVMALPPGYEAQIRPRSGLALKHGISMPNSPGTIDADYRGEVMVLLINLGREAFTITRGMRIAQMVISPVTHANWSEVDSIEHLSSTKRGGGGFGSTGH